MSVRDVDATVSFYETMFGYGRNGGYDRLFNGRVTDKILAYQGVRHRLRWLSDRDPRFQLEIVQFQNPPAHPMPEATVADPGYRRMTLWVAHFDEVLARLAANGVPLLTPPRDFGDGRRVCCRDPDGLLLELLERDVATTRDVDGAGADAGARYDLPVRTSAVT
jgi:catechol 2,3-dioxygenase-like lactoylglutathione lyase family enzyme